jgi:hypothetical protein
MILNLNDPSKIEDTSWIKPMKYVGIWWKCTLKSTWDFAGSQNAQTIDTRVNTFRKTWSNYRKHKEIY